jgi:hypothetical protein
MSLEEVTTRESAFSVLDGYSADRKQELDEKTTRRPLVKSYMLETVPGNHQQPALDPIFERVNCKLMQIDETLFRIFDCRKRETLGLLENLIPRHPVVYTIRESQEMDKWIHALVHGTQFLDHLWLSGRTFQKLLSIVFEMIPGYRYGRIVFQHTSLFETPAIQDLGVGAPAAGAGPEEQEEETDEEPEIVPESDFAYDSDRYIPERRSTRFSIVDKLSEINRILGSMQELYKP